MRPIIPYPCLATLLTLALTGCATLDGATGEARLDLSGQLVHLDRMAMPAQAMALLELGVFRSGGFEVIARSEESLGGRQVPIPFTIAAPARDGGTAEVVELRAAIELDGRIIRASEPVPVFARSGELDLGEIMLQQFNALSFGTAFDCGGTEVMFGEIGAHPVMRVGVEQFPMRQTRSASGLRYEAAGDPATVLHTKGTDAVVSVRGDTLGECRVALEPVLPFRATGNEPPWIARIDGDALTLVSEYGARTRTVQLLDTHQSGPVTRYRAADRQLALVMTASRSVCHDSMSGMPYPYSVDLASAQGVLRGCGGNPMDLLASKEWEITRLDDAVPVSGSRITLRFFPEDGRVAGGASCNRYNAAFQLTGEKLNFSRAASTMMACPEPLMRQEREFHRVLSGINAFDVDGAGMLELIGSEGRMLARPLPIED
jgi:heat shock protein HslJ/uncharacterized lipoprotein YbaY